MGIREQFREFLEKIHGKGRKYYYRIATSSGKAVSQDIPVLVGKRVGWATRQGANFVEVAVAAPSEIVMGAEELINSARQLGLDYSFHPSEGLGLDSSYVEQSRGGFAFENAQNYLRQITIAIGNFKKELERRTNEKHTVTSMNIHAANHLTPPMDERLASDISVDPFGNRTDNMSLAKEKDVKNCIYRNENFMKRIWDTFVQNSLKPDEKVLPTLAMHFAPNQLKKEMENLVNNYIEHLPNVSDEEKKEKLKKPLEDKIKFIVNRTANLDFQRQLVKQAAASEEVLKEIEKKFPKEPEILEILVHSRVIGVDLDDFMKESFVYRQLMPRWMPHSEFPAVRKLWKTITDIPLHENNPVAAEEEFQKLIKQPHGWDRVIAAVAACYVWGHITQITEAARGIVDWSRYKTKHQITIAELLDHYKIQVTLESHMLGDMTSQLRLYLPADLIAVAKAINDTPTNGKKRDVARITIDMEQISTSGLDPLITIDPKFAAREDKNREDLIKQLRIPKIENGDGKLIRVMHVTHPYIMEGGAGHQHGPIRRGDTLNFRYLWSLIQKGFAKNPNEFSIVMYEIGTEKAESVFMLRLMMEMIEADIKPDELKVENIKDLWNAEPKTLKERLLQEFFGLGESEIRHEWHMIQEHSLDPLNNMLYTTKPSHTWTSRAAVQRGSQPDEVQREQYR